uniref:Rho GTPase activating protein 12 n=1 Tax=Salmo trutta TaxID=8032 RepID=A0A673YK72_SALTR
MASDREGRGCELPIAPGQVYIEVEYDYEYKAKERQISIRQGECYMLVKKTNEDWWQVKKEEGTKAFYIPAQYVREVRKALMPPPKPLHLGHHGGGSGGNSVLVKASVSNENLNLTSFSRPSPSSPSPSSSSGAALTPPSQRRDRDANQNPGRDPGSLTNHDRALADIIKNNHTHPHPHNHAAGRGCNTLPRADATFPELRRVPLNVEMPPGHCDSEGSERRNDSESGDELSSSSTEHLQTVSPSVQGGRPESPVYSNLQELKISRSSLPPNPSSSPLHVLGDWETHKDQNGRHYYFNRATQERTWKPPRAKDASSVLFVCVCVSVSVQWIKHVDEQGRPYYYSADGSRSEWKLPKVWPSPRDTPKSRSLDRKNVEPIVLTKWRHSTYVLDTNDKPSEKCGVLNVTKITEHGKKVRKNWTSSWTVLRGSSLLFTKSQGGGTSWFGGIQSKPEFTVDLRGGSIEWASKDKSSKKHVIEVSELLHKIQTGWQVKICSAPEQGSCSPVGRHSMKSSTSMDTSDDKKTRHKLMKFLTRRPTLQAVRDKGYIKDQVFGCSLSDLCQRENASVPSFVTMCIDHMENNALNVDGLYRVSGNLAVIQKLRFAVNHDEKVDLEEGKWEDIHVTTGALKMFFRELPEPLFTYNLFHDFVNAIKIPDYMQRVQSIKELVKQLPKPNQDTMQALFKHLRKVIDHGEENRMTTQSVAIVFGPTLLRPETETWNMAVHMVYQNQIVELILLEYEGIFR